MKRIFYPKVYCICDICKKESYEFVRFIDDENYSEYLKQDGYCRNKINNEHYVCKQCFEKTFGDFKIAKENYETLLYTHNKINE